MKNLSKIYFYNFALFVLAKTLLVACFCFKNKYESYRRVLSANGMYTKGRVRFRQILLTCNMLYRLDVAGLIYVLDRRKPKKPIPPIITHSCSDDVYALHTTTNNAYKILLGVEDIQQKTKF